MKKQTYAVPEGCKITSVDFETNTVVYESVEPIKKEFKKGDVLAQIVDDDDFGKSIIIYRPCYAAFWGVNNKRNKSDFDNSNVYDCYRKATTEERQLLLDKMHEVGKDFDFEKCEVIDYVEVIQEYQKYYEITINFAGNCSYTEEVATSKTNYYKHFFKTEELVKKACDKINEVIVNLKNY